MGNPSLKLLQLLCKIVTFILVSFVFVFFIDILERFRNRQQSSKVVFRIYADSKHKIIKAKRALDGLIMEEKLFFRTKIINNLSNKQVSECTYMSLTSYSRM